MRTTRTTFRIPRSPVDLATAPSLVPFVIVARLTDLRADTQSRKAQDELWRAVTEKSLAASQTTIDMCVQMMRESVRVSSAIAAGNVAALAAAADRTAGKGIRPYARRVRANARRLAR